MESIRDFLRSRRIPNFHHIADSMDLDLINVETLSAMREDDYKLNEYLPDHKDRTAIIEWAKQIQIKKNDLSDSEPSSLLLNPFKSRTVFGEEYILKPPVSLKYLRLDILIGWLHFNEEDSSYKEVSKLDGGGFKSVKCPRESTSKDLLCLCSKLFFGTETTQSNSMWQKLHVNMFDFNKVIMNEGTTVNDLYVLAGLLGQLPLVKCYLATKNKDTAFKLQFPIIASSMITSILEDTKKNITIYNEKYMASSACCDNFLINPIEPILENDDTDNQLRKVMVDNFSLQNSCYDDPIRITQPAPRTHISDPIIQFSPAYNPGLNHIPTGYQMSRNVSIEGTCLKLECHRGNVFEEMIEAFQHIRLKKKMFIYVVFLQPNGSCENSIGSSGVFRDAITEFWNTMYQRCTIGTNFKIPCIIQNFEEVKWQAIAKIMYVSWMEAKYLPIKLARPILEQIIFGKIKSELIPSFLQTLCDNDKNILTRALTNINAVVNDTLIGVLSKFECHVIPNERNMKEILKQIAHVELIQKPYFIIQQFRIQLQDSLSRHIKEEDFLKLYQSMEPTVENILRIVSRTSINVNKPAIKTFGFLEKYIKEMSEELLPKFLRFCTGSDLITDLDIIVEFDHTKIFASAPVAQTCTGVLTLPSNYESFADFQEEMNNIFSSNSWTMDYA